MGHPQHSFSQQHRLEAFASYVRASWLAGLSDWEIESLGTVRIQTWTRTLIALSRKGIEWARRGCALLARVVERRMAFNISVSVFRAAPLAQGLGPVQLD